MKLFEDLVLFLLEEGFDDIDRVANRDPDACHAEAPDVRFPRIEPLGSAADFVRELLESWTNDSNRFTVSQER